jgi:hypothetical protein
MIGVEQGKGSRLVLVLPEAPPKSLYVRKRMRVQIQVPLPNMSVCKTSHIQPWSTHMFRVGQNRIYTPYMTVYMVISLPKIPYTHRIYMVLANPTHVLLEKAP